MNLDKTLIIILIIAVIVMGPAQLPKLAQMLGRSAKAMRDGMEGKDVDEGESPEPQAKPGSDEASSGD